MACDLTAYVPVGRRFQSADSVEYSDMAKSPKTIRRRALATANAPTQVVAKVAGIKTGVQAKHPNSPVIKTAIPPAKKKTVIPMTATMANKPNVVAKVHHSATFLTKHGRASEITASTPGVTTYGPSGATNPVQGAIDTATAIASGTGGPSGASIVSARNGKYVKYAVFAIVGIVALKYGKAHHWFG